MFTGLIQSLGTIQSLTGSRNERRLQIAPDREWRDLQLGESIAVNGVCLSVEKWTSTWFTVYASAETLANSTLGHLGTGSMVNLERALRMGDRLGGHMVSGHVDCMARVTSVQKAGQSIGYRFAFASQWAAFVVPKGSVALDGISLTVNTCGPDFLEVNIIPATQKETNISQWQIGAEVNMETDLIAKYVRRMLDPWQPEESGKRDQGGLSMDFLREHGFG